MQYPGTLKRRMFLAQLETDHLPVPGDDLVTAGKSVADGSDKVVDAVSDQSGLCHCLYIVQIAKAKAKAEAEAEAEAGSLQLLTQPETSIRNIDLPYSLQN